MPRRVPAEKAAIRRIDAGLLSSAKEFIRGARLADKQFLVEVFNTWWGINDFGKAPTPELSIVTAFENECRGYDFVVVDRTAYEKVEARLAELEQFAAKVKEMPKRPAA